MESMVGQHLKSEIRQDGQEQLIEDTCSSVKDELMPFIKMGICFWLVLYLLQNNT